MANYVRKYIKNNLSGNKSFECGVKETGYLEYTLGQFNSQSDTGNGKTPDAITSITFTCTCSAESHSSKQRLRIHLLDSSGNALASSSLVYFDWKVVNGASTTDRPYFSISITGLTVSELNSLSAVKIEYNGAEVPSSYSNSKKPYFWATSAYPATLTINYSAADSYTVTYSKGNNSWTNWPANQTKTPGVALTLSSLTPVCGNSPTTTKTVTLNYNGNGTSNTTGTVKAWNQNWNRFGYWMEDGGNLTFDPGDSYTRDANIQLNVVGWWNESKTDGFVLPSPTRTGHKLSGWYSAASGGTKLGNGGDTFTSTAYSTIYAQWTPDTYTISYNANGAGGTVPASQTKTYGAALTLQSTSGLTNKANTTANGYKITLDANGGAVSSTSVQVINTTSYTINGWNTNASGTGTSYASQASYTANAAATMYVKWSSSTTKGTATLPTPSRTGYTFNGWYTATSGGTKRASGYTPTSSETLYAQWTENTYYVYYKQGLASSTTNLPDTTSRKYTANATIATNNMSKSSTTANSYTATYYQGTASSTTNLPSKQTSINTTTYTKNGWTTGSSNTDDRDYANGATYGANTTNNLTLYPNFTTSTTNGGLTLSSNTMSKNSTTDTGYTVTYAKGTSNGGTVPTAQTATDTIKYTHGGWATSSSGSKAYDKGAATGALSGNLSLYPYFSSSRTRGSVTLAANNLTKSSTNISSYTVTYNANGGSVSPASATATKVRNYTANGWTTTSGSTTKTHSGGASHQVTGNITLYPCFTQTESGGSVTLPTPTRTGYTFKGWSTSSTATSGTAAGNSYAPTSDTTLYAIWSIDQYTITISGSSYGTVKAGSTTISSGDKVNYGTVLTITPTSATGYTTTASSSTGTISNNQLTVDGNETITFTRTGNTYTVEYKQGLASSTTNLPQKQNRTYPNAVTLASNSMSKSNTSPTGYKVTYANGTATGGTLPAAQTATDTKKYTANGWTTSSSLTDDLDYANGASFGSNSTTNLVLYPNFTTSLTRGSVTLAANSMTKSNTNVSSYTVTYDANNGSVSPTSAVATKVRKYTADGWTITSGSTSKTYANNASLQVTGNITLYPCFTQSVSGGSVTLPTPSRSGYTFKGWATSSSATSGVTGSYTPSGDVTLYATWSRNVSITKQPVNTTVAVGSNISVSVTAVGDGLTYQWYYKNAGSSSFSESSITTSTYTTTMNQDARIGRQVFCTITDANGNSQSSNIVTLSATYQVIYNANNGSGTMSNSTHDYRTAGPLTTNAFTRTGYSFLGWSTSPTATSATYTNGQSVSKLTYDSPTITLYAVWSQSQAFIHRYNSSSNKEKVRVWYYETASKYVPVKKVYYYNGTSWIDVTEGDNT